MNTRTINYQGAEVTVSDDGKYIYYNNSERKICYNHDGYAVCHIKTYKGWRWVGVARLVATAFIPNPDNLPEVNHKDYNRKNADVNNLEWISHADNVRYSIINRPDMRGTNNPNYGNRVLSKRYAEDKELALIKQSRKGKTNGRARKISLYHNGEFVKTFDYIGECCQWLIDNKISDCKSIDDLRKRIYIICKHNEVYKDGYTFVKH